MDSTLVKKILVIILLLCWTKYDYLPNKKAQGRKKKLKIIIQPRTKKEEERKEEG
jgi:hypothetical protein|tara:strand:+ start:277 stop:441 length:165 start_codon:yes stop_codon:yes gene_type:complete